MKCFTHAATLICLAAATSAYAQVGSINSAKVTPRVFNDIPGAALTVNNSYPTTISFDEQRVSQTGGFANRDVWQFSNNGGASPYQFNNNDFFQATMTLTLTGTPLSPRKEAGFLLNTIGGDGQFIVNTDAHEVVAFGGPLPFYAFPATYDSGETITLGLTYFLDGNGKRAIIYTADGVSSPAQEFSNLEQGIIDSSTLGGYFQIVNDANNPNNGGTAVFGNIGIPEPATIATNILVVLGAGLGVWRHRGRKV